MTLNISKGNMYPFITDTWNTVKGKCPHDCSYCYMKRFGEQKPIRFDESELKTDLGEGKFIFVGSSCDMWADGVENEWIHRTLLYCNKFKNKYLFQSKNPSRFMDFISQFPPNTILGTTIESNKTYNEISKTPSPTNRAVSLNKISSFFSTMVTIEPIMDFDNFSPIRFSLPYLVHLCKPQWVNIGADSQGHELPEPSSEKIQSLIDNLRDADIEVKIKSNLKRLMT